MAAAHTAKAELPKAYKAQTAASPIVPIALEASAPKLLDPALLREHQNKELGERVYQLQDKKALAQLCFLAGLTRLSAIHIKCRVYED